MAKLKKSKGNILQKMKLFKTFAIKGRGVMTAILHFNLKAPLFRRKVTKGFLNLSRGGALVQVKFPKQKRFFTPSQ